MPRTKVKSIPLVDALAQGIPLDLKQASAFLQVSTASIKRLVKTGLPCFRVGFSYRFDVSAMQTWLSGTLPNLRRQSAGLHPKEQQRLH